jgi:protocatechuate 3,4-dioxygenase beta subunit
MTKTTQTPWLGRRTVIAGISAAASSLLFPVVPSRAQHKLIATPRQAEGPFYPVEWSGDVDADLVVVNGETAPALGQITHIYGRVLDASAQP